MRRSTCGIGITPKLNESFIAVVYEMLRLSLNTR